MGVIEMLKFTDTAVRKNIFRHKRSPAMSSYRKLGHEHVQLVYEAHLLRPNSFCGRSFSVQRDGKVSTKPELRGAAGVQFV